MMRSQLKVPKSPKVNELREGGVVNKNEKHPVWNGSLWIKIQFQMENMKGPKGVRKITENEERGLREGEYILQGECIW